MRDLAQAFLELSEEELTLLSSIEAGMRTHERVPTSAIARSSGLPSRKVEHLLGRLFERGLVLRESLHYIGYTIGFDAFDLLALRDFVKKGRITAIGCSIGVGKESVVYQALGDDGSALAVKLHRQGTSSFKHVRRQRDHLKDRPRISWLHAASLAARHEFEVMERLCGSASVPKPVAQNRHALAMEYVEGPTLNRVVLSDPALGLELILDEVAAALRLGMIHADLSEFNIIIGESGPVLIDWPQAVKTTHPNSGEILERDLSNVLRFFDRKYEIKMPLQDAILRVCGAEQA